jgi:hypothetical protein
MAQSFILSGVRRGLSANRIQDALQLKDLGYRRTEILKDVRYWKGALEQGSKIKYTWTGETVDPNLYTETRWRMSARYETVCRVRYTDRITGEEHEDYVTVKHEHLEDGLVKSDLYQSKTRGDIEEAARDAIPHYRGGEDAKNIEVTPMIGFFNPMIG